MKVKECNCYKLAMNDFLDKKMINLRADIENEVKKVLGLNFLGMITDYLSNSRIMDIFKLKSGRLISTFILLKKPVIQKKDDLYILHVKDCPKLAKAEEKKAVESEIEEEGFEIPIN